MEVTAWWEGLILPVDDHIPLEVFDDKTKMQLRRLEFTKATRPTGPKFSHLLLNILPSCTNLIDLKIPQMEFKTYVPNGSAITMWMNRLEKYHGPSYPLGYLHNGTPLHRLRTTTPDASEAGSACQPTTPRSPCECPSDQSYLGGKRLSTTLTLPFIIS